MFLTKGGGADDGIRHTVRMLASQRGMLFIHTNKEKARVYGYNETWLVAEVVKTCEDILF